MTHEYDAAAKPDGHPGATSPRTEVDGTGGAFATAFDGGQADTAEPYVRLVPSAGEDTSGKVLERVDAVPANSGRRTFDPWDIERSEYRLLARALTNGDDVTEHLAAMTLVQLVKFLRAAGVSVPDFPATGGVPDPSATARIP